MQRRQRAGAEVAVNGALHHVGVPAHDRQRLVDHRGDVGRLARQVDLGAVEAAGHEVANLVDRGDQALLRVDDDVGELGQLGVAGDPGLDRLGVADQRQLAIQLVGDAGQHAADRGQLLGANQPLGGGRQLARGGVELGVGPLDLAARGAQGAIALLQRRLQRLQVDDQLAALELGAQLGHQVGGIGRLAHLAQRADHHRRLGGGVGVGGAGDHQAGDLRIDRLQLAQQGGAGHVAETQANQHGVRRHDRGLGQGRAARGERRDIEPRLLGQQLSQAANRQRILIHYEHPGVHGCHVDTAGRDCLSV